MNLPLCTAVHVLDRHGDIMDSGRIVAQSVCNGLLYDVRLETGDLMLNVPEKRVRGVVYVG